MKKRLFNLLVLVVLFGLTLVMTGCDFENIEEVKVITGISIATPATKTSYEVGEEFSSAGLTVNLDFEDGTHELLDENSYVIDSSAFNKNLAGKYTITISYFVNRNMKCTYDVNVNKKETGLTISAKNNVLLNDNFYTWYGEDLGLKVTVNYNDGTKDEYEGTDALMKNFSLEGTHIFDMIPNEEGDQTITLFMTNKPSLKGTFAYKVYDVNSLTLKAIKVVSGPTYNTITSLDDFVEEGISVVALYEETGDQEFKYSWYYVNTPEELTLGENEFTVVSYENDEISATFKMNVVDASEYTLDSIKLADEESIRKVFFVGEQDAYLFGFGTKIIKTYKKAGCADLVISTTCFEVTDDGAVDTSEAGKKTYTITVDESEVKYEVDVEVKNITLTDGVYIVNSFEGMQIAFKVVNGKAYLFDATTEEYATEETEIQYVEAITDMQTGAVTIRACLYYNEELLQTISADYILNSDGTLSIDTDYTIIVKEEDIVKVNAYTELLNGMVLYKVNNKLTEEELEYVKNFGKLYLDAEGKNEITADTVITSNEVYLIFVQEDYTGKPFLGKYLIEGEEAFTVKATCIETEDGNGGYTAQQIDGVWVISYSGFNMYYDAEAKTLTMDMGFIQMVYVKAE